MDHIIYDTLIRRLEPNPGSRINRKIPTQNFAQGAEHGTYYVVMKIIPTTMATKKTWVNSMDSFDPAGGGPSV